MQVWGEDMLLYTKKLQSQTFARALNYVEAFSISRQTLLEQANDYPATFLRIRVYIGMLALRRIVVHMAAVERQQRKLTRCSGRSPYLQAFFHGDIDPLAPFVSPPGHTTNFSGRTGSRAGSLRSLSTSQHRSSTKEQHGGRRPSTKPTASEPGRGSPQRSHRGETDGAALKGSPPSRGGGVDSPPLLGNLARSTAALGAALDLSYEDVHRSEARRALELEEKHGALLRSLARDVAAIKSAVGASRGGGARGGAHASATHGGSKGLVGSTAAPAANLAADGDLPHSRAKSPSLTAAAHHPRAKSPTPHAAPRPTSPTPMPPSSSSSHQASSSSHQASSHQPGSHQPGSHQPSSRQAGHSPSRQRRGASSSHQASSGSRSRERTDRATQERQAVKIDQLISHIDCALEATSVTSNDHLSA